MELESLSIDNLSYYIGSHPILSEIHRQIPLGSIVGLIGPNGAGKSTLLKMMGGLLSPRSGQVSLNGINILKIPEKKRAQLIAMVPQDPQVGFGFTVEEIVAMGRYPFASRFSPLSQKCMETIEDALEATGTTNLTGRLITQISGGEKQRVFVARALAQEPSILLLDEPTANLDIRYQLEILDMIKSLQEKRCLSVVMAIHDLHLASRYCSYLLVLKEGQLIAYGSTDSVLTESLVENVFQVKATLIKDAPYKYLQISPLY